MLMTLNNRVMINHIFSTITNSAFYILVIGFIRTPVEQLLLWMRADSLGHYPMQMTINNHAEMLLNVLQVIVAAIAIIYGIHQICKIRGELRDRKERKLKEKNNYKKLDNTPDTQ